MRARERATQRREAASGFDRSSREERRTLSRREIDEARRVQDIKHLCALGRSARGTRRRCAGPRGRGWRWR